MTGKKTSAANGELTQGMAPPESAARTSWPLVAFLALLLTLAGAGYKVFFWQYRLTPAAPPCQPSLSVECPIPWLGDAMTIIGFGGSLLGAAASYFKRRKFGRWLFTAAAMLGVMVITGLLESWLQGGGH